LRRCDTESPSMRKWYGFNFQWVFASRGASPADPDTINRRELTWLAAAAQLA